MEFIGGRDQRVEGFFHTGKCCIDNMVSAPYHLVRGVVWLNPDLEIRQRDGHILWHILWESAASQVARHWGWSQAQGELSVGMCFYCGFCGKNR